ncbi:MAG TPA: hypothetical protein VH062_10635 [Polyangiaceae bacterium]|jgi:hypothetical protein|nr:hypothetical protein [Polyangiaceae bacterium]
MSPAEPTRGRAAVRLALSVAVAGALSALFAGCASEPDTIRLLDQPDSGGSGGSPGSGHSTCRDDSDCDRDTPHCNPDLRSCVECQSTLECAEGLVCSQATHSCSPTCASSDECAGLEHPICSAGVCSDCTDDRDCAATPGKPRCNTRQGVCVECVEQSDCGPSPCRDDCFVCDDSRCQYRT